MSNDAVSVKTERDKMDKKAVAQYFIITTEHYEWLRKMSFGLRRSMSSLMREALDLLQEKYKEQV